jgi:hypothetical protein
VGLSDEGPTGLVTDPSPAQQFDFSGDPPKLWEFDLRVEFWVFGDVRIFVEFWLGQRGMCVV